jgi:type II secretory pathway component PulF
VPLYRYEAFDRAGNKVVGAMQVADERSLTARLAALGYQPTHVETAGASGREVTATGGVLGTPPVSRESKLSADRRSIAQMFHQLFIAFRAGMPAFQALTTVSGQSPHPAVRQALVEIGRGVQNGETISENMARYPRLFSRGDVGTIRAAEMGGFLPEALEMLARQHEQEENTQRRLRIWLWFFHANASLIPFILALLAFFPAFAASEFKLAEGLRAVSRALLTTTLPLLAIYVGSFSAFRMLRTSPRFTERWHRLLLRLPIVGKIGYLRSNAVFTRTLQYLTHAGVSARSAWETAAGAVPNRALAAQFDSAQHFVNDTGRFTPALESVRLLDPHDVGVIATGESTGEVAEALNYVANRYEAETETALGASVVRGAVTSVTWVVILTGVVGVAFVYAYLKMSTIVLGWIE